MRRRIAYREVQELEDLIAHQISLRVELERLRKHASSTEEWLQLNAMTRHADVVYDWLRDRRMAMQHGPGEEESEETDAADQ